VTGLAELVVVIPHVQQEHGSGTTDLVGLVALDRVSDSTLPCCAVTVQPLYRTNTMMGSVSRGDMFLSNQHGSCGHVPDQEQGTH
jgi:hypothetical protein